MSKITCRRVDKRIHGYSFRADIWNPHTQRAIDGYGDTEQEALLDLAEIAKARAAFYTSIETEARKMADSLKALDDAVVDSKLDDATVQAIALDVDMEDM